MPSNRPQSQFINRFEHWGRVMARKDVWTVSELAPPARGTPSRLEEPAISRKQPFAWLVANGYKDVENRSKPTKYRGPVLVHVSLSREYLRIENWVNCRDYDGICLPLDLEFGGVIGIVDIVDCARDLDSYWYAPGHYGYVLENARRLKFRECSGQVGLFRPKWK